MKCGDMSLEFFDALVAHTLRHVVGIYSYADVDAMYLMGGEL